MRVLKVVAALILAGLLHAADAQAQGTINDVIAFLMTNQAVQTSDFERDRQAAEIARDTVARALLVNLTSVPIGTSSSGFLYRLNPELGTVQRATESFGAFFTERALTAGAGRVSFGLAATTSGFDRLDGEPLRDGTLVTIANRFRDEDAPFDTESLTLRVRSSTMTFLANVGVTERLEIGGAIPFVRLELDGQRLNVYRGTPFVQATASGIASGIADVALRAKYTLVSNPDGGLAAAAEFRLPTGDSANLLGTGSAAWRLFGIGSVDHGRIGFHGNAGVVGGGLSNEVTFAGALAVAAQPRVTVSGEIFGRHVSQLRDIRLVAVEHPTIAGVDTLRLTAGNSGTTLMSALVGVKWNLSGNFVLAGHVTWPLTERGLTARVTPAIGLEYAFPR